MSSDQSFDSVWADLQARVRPYNSKQRKQILQNLSSAVQQIFAAMPAPRREGDDSTPQAQASPSGKRLLSDVETLISDRMASTGADKSIFTRHDQRGTGSVSTEAFVAAISTLGVTLNDDEVEGLVGKYDSDGEGRSINWAEFLRFLSAQAEVPRSTAASSYSSSAINRPHTSGQGSHSMLSGLPEGPEQRMARGLKAMRESMYQRNSNFHSLFHSMQSQATKSVPIEVMLQRLGSLGFPPGVVSNDELFANANQCARRAEGQLTYSEFLAFCTGVAPEPEQAQDNSALDSPALINALVKVNNLNLRKFFKEADLDNDGLISTDELARGMVESGGLHPSQTSLPSFREYLETFCTKKKGAFGYADFIKFVNARPMGNQGHSSGQPAHPASLIRVPDEATPSAMLELLIKHLRSTHISVESMFQNFDSDFDGALDEAEFFQGVNSLGFGLNPTQSKAFFEAVDENKSGSVDIQEFAQLTVNPNKSMKLSTRVKHAPGGASSVPMGSYANADVPESRPGTARGSSVRGPAFKLSSTQQPLTAEEVLASTPRQGRGGGPAAGQPRGSIDLSFNPEGTGQNQQQGNNSGNTLEGSNVPEGQQSDAQRNRGRNPPGGKSSINFGGDHGAASPRQPATKHTNIQSDPRMLNFDANHPVEAVRPRTAGANTSSAALSSLQLGDDGTGNTYTATPQRSKGGPLHSPGGESSISFNQADFEVPRSGKRVNGPTVSTFNLRFEEAQPSPSFAQPNYRQQDHTTIDLGFDGTATDNSNDPQRRGRKAAAAQDTLSLAHSSSRNDEDLNALTHGRKHVEGSPTTISVGNDSGKQLLASYAEPSAEVDPALINELSTKIYAHSQKLRHTFTEWNRNSQSSTLSKENFVAGARALNINLSDAQADALFTKFDVDGDNAITYSEFVRLLASK